MRHDDKKQHHHTERNFLLLAEYLFSFLDLLAFFKQPSHTKLQGEKLKLSVEKMDVETWTENRNMLLTLKARLFRCARHISGASYVHSPYIQQAWEGQINI